MELVFDKKKCYIRIIVAIIFIVFGFKGIIKLADNIGRLSDRMAAWLEGYDSALLTITLGILSYYYYKLDGCLIQSILHKSIWQHK